MRRWWILGAVLAAACSYDAGALGTDTSGESTTKATSSTSATTTGGLDTGTGSSTTTPTTTSEGSTSQASESSTGSDEVLADNGLLARWYIDETSQGQSPSLVLDYHAVEPLDLMIDYGGDELSYTEIDGNRSLVWTGIEHNARPIAAIAGTKIEAGLGTSRKATFELVLAPQELSNQTSRLLHIGTGNQSGDFVIGSNGTGQVEVRWHNITREFDASFTGDRQVLHVVVDTSQTDAADRSRAYLDGVELFAQGTEAPDEGERFALQSSSSLVFGNRADGQRSFRGSLGYVAIYTNAFGPARIEQNMHVLLASDDAP